MKSIPISLWLAIGFCSLHSCIELSNTYTMVAPGEWRALLDLRDQATLPPHPEHTDTETEFDLSQTPTGILPFNFRVEYITPDSMQFYVINGHEEMPVSAYKYEKNVQGETGRLTLFFPIYDTRIVANVEAGVMEGFWHVDYKENYSIPFKAYLGQEFRFTDIPEEPAENISGRWAMTFSTDTPEEYPAIGTFDQNGTQLYANINTETGDYRYAGGNVSGRDILFSSFNGLQAYLYEGKIISADSIIGAFYSGNHFRTTWEGARDSEVSLRSPDLLNTATTDRPVNWKARSVDGELIDFSSPPYEGQVKILEIMGSWCPNCHDEARFLAEWQKANPDLPVEIVSLSFERYQDSIKSLEVLNAFRQRWNMSWPVVYGGSTRDARESELLSFIGRLRAYPTLVVFDAANRIQYVHTGFYGPATEEYAGFKKEFDQKIRQIINRSKG